jgi:hypothetical protein
MKDKTITLTLLIFLTLIVSCQKETITFKKEVYNSKGSLKLIVFIKEINSNKTLNVSVEGYDYELKASDDGNVFVANNLTELNKYTLDSLILVKWFSNNEAEINYPAESNIEKIESEVESVGGKVAIKHHSRKGY